MPKNWRPARPKSWFHVRVASAGAASLASGSQVGVADETLDHPTSGQDYGPGTLTGLRLFIEMYPNAALTRYPYVVILVMPAGAGAAPTVNTEGGLKANEKYVWGVVQVTCDGTPGAGSVYYKEVVFKSKRRIEEGDRIHVIVCNDTGTAFGASATTLVDIDTYVQRPAA